MKPYNCFFAKKRREQSLVIDGTWLYNRMFA